MWGSPLSSCESSGSSPWAVASAHSQSSGAELRSNHMCTTPCVTTPATIHPTLLPPAHPLPCLLSPNPASTPQFVREFAKLGLTRSVGGVLALALARELTPVVTAIILAGRVGSAFAAELGTMQVSDSVCV